MHKKKGGSLDWLVAARGYAMFGVFLGHLIDCYYDHDAYEQIIPTMKVVGQLLEPTFVPFFAILTGAFYSRGTSHYPAYVKLKFSQRIFPVYFYLLLVLPFYFIFPDPEKPLQETLTWGLGYLVGVPWLSWPSWFLVALFTSEMVYFFIQPHAKGKYRIWGLALACYTVGWGYNHFVFNYPGKIGLIGMFWMLHTSMLFCAFFLVGAWVKPYLIRMSRWPDWKVWLLALIAVVVMYPAATFNDISPPPEGSLYALFFKRPMAVISVGVYGHYILFMLSTLGGAAVLLCISRLLPATKFMRLCGDQSLVLLGLNGIFMNVLNRYLVEMFRPPEGSVVWALAYAFVVAAVTFALCLPVAIWISKYFPQLTGRPMLAGPILPALYKKNQ